MQSSDFIEKSFDFLLILACLSLNKGWDRTSTGTHTPANLNELWCGTLGGCATVYSTHVSREYGGNLFIETRLHATGSTTSNGNLIKQYDPLDENKGTRRDWFLFHVIIVCATNCVAFFWNSSPVHFRNDLELRPWWWHVGHRGQSECTHASFGQSWAWDTRPLRSPPFVSCNQNMNV